MRLPDASDIAEMLLSQTGLLAHRGSPEKNSSRIYKIAHVLCNVCDSLNWISDVTKIVTPATMHSKEGPKILRDSEKRDREQVESGRPAKRLKGLLEEDAISNKDDSVSDNGRGDLVWTDDVTMGGQGFHINQEFARRFEHNKKREELHKR